MSPSAPCFPSPGKMEPKDFIWMAALGTTARAPAGIDDILCAIDDIAGQWWTPVGEVVVACIENLLVDGKLALAPQSRPGKERLVITSPGRAVLSQLLSRPLERTGCPLGYVGLHLKLAFLDLLPDDERGAHLHSAIHDCQAEIREWERRCRLCSASGKYGVRWMSHQTSRLRQDLSVLAQMAGLPPFPQDGEASHV